MEQDNNIDKLLRDAAGDFGVSYEDAYWQQFQQMRNAASGHASWSARLLSFIKKAKLWMLLVAVSVAAIMYTVFSSKEQPSVFSSKEPVVIEKMNIEQPGVLSGKKSDAGLIEKLPDPLENKISTKAPAPLSPALPVAAKPGKVSSHAGSAAVKSRDNVPAENTVIAAKYPVKNSRGKKNKERLISQAASDSIPAIVSAEPVTEDIVEKPVVSTVVKSRIGRKKTGNVNTKRKDLYIFPQTTAHTVDVTSVAADLVPLKPEEPVKKDAAAGTVQKPESNKLFEDFVVDETPVDPPKKEVIQQKYASSERKQDNGTNKSAHAPLKDTANITASASPAALFERDLTSTAYVAKKDSITAISQDKPVNVFPEPVARKNANDKHYNVFLVDAVAGATGYKALSASTDSGAAGNANGYDVRFFVGARLEYEFLKRISVFIQPVFLQRSHVNAVTSSTVVQYGFGSTTTLSTLDINKLYYVEVPAGIGVKLGEKHKVYVGGGVAYLVAASFKMDGVDKGTKVQKRDVNGLKSVDYYLMLAYQYEIRRRLKVFAQWQYAPAPAIDTKYYKDYRNPYNSSLKIGISVGLYNNE